MIQTSSAVMQLFKASYFNVAAGSRHLWPYSNDNAGSLYPNFHTTSEPRAFSCNIPAAGNVYLLNIELESFEYVLQITQLATKPKVRFLRT